MIPDPHFLPQEGRSERRQRAARLQGSTFRHTWGAVAGAAVSVIGGVVSSSMNKQKAPKAATANPVDVQATQAQAIAGNQANLGKAETLAAGTNSFNQDQSIAMLEKALPGFSALKGKLLDSANSDLNSSTTLPKDTQDKIAQFAAEKGINRGTSGNFNDFSLVKDFGINLMDWQNASRVRALNTLSSVFGMTPRVNPMSPMSMFVDPNAAIASQFQNSQNIYSAQQANYNAQAAASNANSAMWAGVTQNAFGAVAAGTSAYVNSASDSVPPSQQEAMNQKNRAAIIANYGSF